jgi:CRP/FNR family transcriptional regulator, anaerobic regulatory protein
MLNVNPAHIANAEIIRFPAYHDVRLSRIVTRHLPQGACRKLACRQTLWSEGDKRENVYLIRSGSICFFRMLPDGRRAVIGFALPGDFIGLGSDVHFFGAETMQPTKLDVMPVHLLDRGVLADAEFANLVREEVTRSLMAAYGHIASISKLSAAERLACFLVDLADRNQRNGLSPNSVILPMRRIEIADYLGLTIETVSRTFTALRNLGLIDLSNPAIVQLKNFEKLSVLARGDRDGSCDRPRRLVA